MKIKIQKQDEERVYFKKTEEFIFNVNGKEVRVLKWQEDGRDIDCGDSDYEVNEDDREKLTQQEADIFEDNIWDLFDVDKHYVLEETYYCDICSDQEATTEVECSKCEEKHYLCTMCEENGHEAIGKFW